MKFTNAHILELHKHNYTQINLKQKKIVNPHFTISLLFFFFLNIIYEFNLTKGIDAWTLDIQKCQDPSQTISIITIHNILFYVNSLLYYSFCFILNDIQGFYNK